jgi:hypothetical protein
MITHDDAIHVSEFLGRIIETMQRSWGPIKICIRLIGLKAYYSNVACSPVILFHVKCTVEQSSTDHGTTSSTIPVVL